MSFTTGPSGAVTSFAITRSSDDLDVAGALPGARGPVVPPPGGSAYIATSFNYDHR